MSVTSVTFFGSCWPYYIRSDNLRHGLIYVSHTCIFNYTFKNSVNIDYVVRLLLLLRASSLASGRIAVKRVVNKCRMKFCKTVWLMSFSMKMVVDNLSFIHYWIRGDLFWLHQTLVLILLNHFFGKITVGNKPFLTPIMVSNCLSDDLVGMCISCYKEIQDVKT